MKVRDIIKRVEEDGWYLIRIRGEHRHYSHPVKKGIVTISGQLRQDMPIGTLLNVWKQAQLGKEVPMAKILVIVEKGETSYGAYSPDVPGCVAVGDTREEALQLFREALQGHLELMREEHLPLPEPQTSVEYIDMPLSA